MLNKDDVKKLQDEMKTIWDIRSAIMKQTMVVQNAIAEAEDALHELSQKNNDLLQCIIHINGAIND